MKEALIFSAAAILIAGGITISLGWYLSSSPPDPACIVIDGNEQGGEAMSFTRNAERRGEPIPEFCEEP
jgi:hypothetical protein